ncbi:MAG: glycosyltransferase family 4 protein [Planctomycetota bacterium]
MSRRLTLVIHALHGGGAEKSMALAANHWAARGNEVTLITFDSLESDVYHVTPAVHRVALNAMWDSPSAVHAVVNNYRRWRRLRTAIREARGDWVISFTDKTNVSTLLACLATGARVVVCERIDPRPHGIGFFWSQLRRWSYPRSTAVVVQTQAAGDFVQQFVRRKPVYVIPNCVWSGTVPDSLPTLECRPRRIVAMGRLVPQKGFDLLVEAFAQVAPDHPEWTAVLVGEGPERQRLETLIEQRGLSGRVSLCGWRDDPARLLSQAQVFVLSSRYEGFPNALLEAMACGVVPVAFDCDSGPRDIVRHNVDGLLVPPADVERLAQTLSSLLSDTGWRQRLAASAREVTQRFGVDVFFNRWEEILCVKSRSNRG